MRRPRVTGCHRGATSVVKFGMSPSTGSGGRASISHSGPKRRSPERDVECACRREAAQSTGSRNYEVLTELRSSGLIRPLREERS